MELIHASVLGDLDRVRQLLDRGTDPNIQDEAGDTTLMYASEKGNIIIVVISIIIISIISISIITFHI